MNTAARDRPPWIGPAPIQCDTGMKQGEEYVKHLMCSYVSEYMYGIIARVCLSHALMELGVKVKVCEHVWS